MNQQLDRFVFQMQSQVGCSGWTLHQVSSEYLVLKTQNQDLAQKIEELEIPEADCLVPEQFNLHCEVLGRLQIYREKVLHGITHPNEHPWQPFAHPDLQTDEFDLLLRTIRFVSIQLSKFWVEVQSFPLFLNTVDDLSIHGVEKIFQWLTSSPPWHEKIQQPRVISALTQSVPRKLLFEFVRDVKSARALCERAALYESSAYLTATTIQAGFDLLSEGVDLVRQYDIGPSVQAELELQISQKEKQLEDVHSVREFFSSLTDQTGIPLARLTPEAQKIFAAKANIQKIPKKLLPWRQPQILAPNQLVRIQGLQDRARPILDARKRVESHFQLSAALAPEKLRKTATILTSGGLLRSFRAPYQEALRTYRSLLRSELLSKNREKETAFQMAERLNEWATFLEQSHTFDKNLDVRKTFGGLFRGIDTDFALAIEANTWASHLRAELALEDSSFTEALLDFIFKATEEELNAVASALNSEEAESLQTILKTSELATDDEFEEIESETTTQLNDLNRLLEVIGLLEIPSGTPFSVLEELLQTNEEIIFLTTQIDVSSELKGWLKGHYRGIDTDLTLIEQGAAYVHAIEHAEIPDPLKKAFLSVHGPQRFGENRALVIPALVSLTALKELLQKLEVVSHGQAQTVLDDSIPKLLASIQQALKQPALLTAWVTYIRCEREARVCGLAPVLDFFETKGLPDPQFVTGYKLAFHASLLKKALLPTVH